MKDDFISTVTHELRTPLTSIRAFSEILHDHADIDPAERRRFLALIVKESERLTRLINQVLDLAKLESGMAEWHTAELDLRSIVEDAASAMSQLFRSRGVALEVVLPASAAMVEADRDRLMQVLLNLLSNAVKFCEEGRGRVQVRLLERLSDVCVEVEDNGIGISARDQGVVFEKFRQAGDRLTQKPAGSGLGLAICREIVAHFGGRLWVRSEPGLGSVFTFSLPATAPVGSREPVTA